LHLSLFSLLTYLRTRSCNDYSCYGALEIVGTITITITYIFVDQQILQLCN